MATDKNSHELPSLSTSLLDRVQQMQPDAWARMVAVFSPIVYRWARQSGLPAADAADVVQDVFISIARRIGSFQPQQESGSFRSWLATITRNRVRDSFRKQRLHPGGIGGSTALNQLQQFPTPEPTVDSLEHSISLSSLNDQVPRRVLQMVKSNCDPVTWQAFWLTVVVGDSANDVADRLGMNVASVYQAKTRILARIRKRMGELP